MISGLRMCFFIDVFELVDGIVRIHLRSRQAAVPKQFFYCVEVGTVIGKMGGEGVPQYVRAALFNGGDKT